ncbi:uncharacterized protein LOC134837812 [Culicoides brevitarsis]|uniref:uncharacterized protein LOC134837812 n=1 Tax=Culicoides brevitarsis TaxID=469753 RepID=UPI00307C67B1
MSWLKEVCERGGSTKERTWLEKMGIAVEAMDKNNQTEEIFEQIIEKTLEKPLWYQELSQKQMTLADKLYENVRDDHDFRTTYRVRGILQQLGVNPVAKDDIISKVLIVSRGNDLAFLWFLLDICYLTFRKFTEIREYSLNERLLISCIAHLDMITTLRGLARILPAISLPEISISSHEPPKIARKIHRKKISPYLIPNLQPKIPVSKHFTRPKPKNVDLFPYQKWNDPNYFVENEENRWFAQKSAMSIADPRPKSSGEKIIDAFLDETLEKITSPNFDKSQVLKALCFKHKNEETTNRRRKILEKLFQENPRNFTSDIERDVVHQIELDLAATREEFENLAKKYQEQTIVRSVIQELVLDVTAKKFIEPCENCSECNEDLNLYKNLLLRNLSQENLQKICENGDFYVKKSPETNNFQFNYRKIFEDDFRETCPVKNALNKVLDLENFETEDEAIRNWMQNVWKFELEMWNEKQKEMFSKQGSENFIKYELKDSRESITKLLKDHLLLLSKNPKYVFASLPQAHHHPVLQEWLRQFYGFKNSRKQQEKILKQNMMEWNFITTAMPKRKLISNKEILPGKTFVTYDSRKSLENLSNRFESFGVSSKH